MKPSEYLKAAEKMADDIMKHDKQSYRGRRKEGREMLIKYILEEMNQYDEIEEDSEELEIIEEGASEMFGESWDNRY